MRSDGAWYGAIGVQAWRTGELWTLHAGPDEFYFNKPPLAFWLHGLVLHVFGLGAWQARVPSIVAAGVCVVATTGLARRLAGDRAGMLSGMMLATTLEFFRRSREISLDMWQLAWMLLGAWAVIESVRSRRMRWALAGGLAFGLALLTKPLMALVAPVLLAAWAVWISRGRAAWAIAGAAGVALLVATPWHASMIHLHGSSFSARYFGSEVADRATGASGFAGGVGKPWWFYFEQIATGGWPWLVFAVLAVVTWARGRAMSESRAAERWALVWALGWLALLTVFPDRRDRYALPIWPGLAMLAGVWLAGEPWRWTGPAVSWLERWGVPAMAALGLGLAVAPVRFQSPPAEHWVAVEAWLREHPDAEVWLAGEQPARGARVYLASGRWPRWTNHPERLDAGAYVLYHREVPVTPSAREIGVLDVSDLRLTQLGAR